MFVVSLLFLPAAFSLEFGFFGLLFAFAGERFLVFFRLEKDVFSSLSKINNITFM